MKADKVDKAVRSAKASLAVEGLHVSDREESLIKERLNGKITESEFKRRALELINE
jgi:uncharacterized membrane protein